MIASSVLLPAPSQSGSLIADTSSRCAAVFRGEHGHSERTTTSSAVMALISLTQGSP